MIRGSTQARNEVHRAIVEQARDGIVLLDFATLTFVDFNDAACWGLGYSRTEFAQLHISEIAVETDRHRVEDVVQRLLETGHFDFEVQHRCRDGSVREIWSSNRLLTLDGRQYVSAVWRDVTERKRAEAAARQERMFREAMLAAIPGLFFAVDRSGRLVLAQWNLDGSNHHSAHDVVGLRAAEIVAKEQRPLVERALETAFAEGSATVEAELVRDGGQRTPVLISGKRTEIEGETLLVGIGIDITPQRRAIEALRLSEQRLRLALDAARQGFFEADLATGRLTVDEHYSDMLGHPSAGFEESLHSLYDRLHPDDAAAIRGAFDGFLEGERATFCAEYRLRTAHGDWRWILCNACITERDAAGRPLKLIGTHTDVTERRQTELDLDRYRLRLEDMVQERTAALAIANRRLRQSDLRLHAMLELSQQAPQLSEHELMQRVVNEAERLTESRIAYLHFVEADGESIRLGTWSDQTRTLCNSPHDAHYPLNQAGLWADSIRTGVPVVHNDYPLVRDRHGYPQGHVPIERHLGVPVVDGGKVRVLLGVGNKATPYDDTDVSELQLIGNDFWRIYTRRRAELELAAAKEAADVASRAKTAFLANMSHEIRTPLNAIAGFTHLLHESGLNAVQAEHLAQIETAGRHLLEVINQILDLAKIEADKLVLESVPVDLHDVVHDVARMLRGQAGAKGIDVECEIAPDVPVDCLGDPTRLRQALLNYAANALKFTERGRICLRLRNESLADDRASVRFEVEDTGIGIPADDLARLFNEFEQADNSPTRRHGGTGLGLAITRRLAGLMQGRAGASSTPGRGSTFWFTAVLGRGACAIPQSPARSGAGPQDARAALIEEFRDARILVVEDDPVSQLLACKLLQRAGLRVDLAADGEEAIELVRGGQYALVLMDMQMPRLDGPSATSRIRNLPDLAFVPVIAMTANAFAEDRERCFAAGMNDFIAKPVQPDRLYATVLDWLRRCA